MTAANVTNNHNSPLGVGNVSIEPGATALVPNWDRVKNGNAVKIWLDQDIISAKEISDKKAAAAQLPGLPGLPGADQVSAEDQRKDALIAELKELTGQEKTRKTSIESLEKQIEEAKAAK